MNYTLNSYAVVEDKSGLHLVPSYTRDRYLTVLVDATTVVRAGRYLAAYAQARSVNQSHAVSHKLGVAAMEIVMPDLPRSQTEWTTHGILREAARLLKAHAPRPSDALNEVAGMVEACCSQVPCVPISKFTPLQDSTGDRRLG